MPRTEASAPIHVGIGGWDHDPWRETFYPAGLARSGFLAHAASRLTGLEVNATFHRLRKPEDFARWAEAVPDDFRLAIKASRFCTNRRDLGTAAEAVGRFLGQGFTLLGPKLGPILWQLPPGKLFDPAEMGAFFALLPTQRDGVALRHAVEVRHESFRCRPFLAMAQAAGIAICYSDGVDHPEIADLTADFVYCRLKRSEEAEPQGYKPQALDRWAERLRLWAAGGQPADLPHVGEGRAAKRPREVFAFFIGGAKARNPAAALALIERLKP